MKQIHWLTALLVIVLTATAVVVLLPPPVLPENVPTSSSLPRSPTKQTLPQLPLPPLSAQERSALQQRMRSADQLIINTDRALATIKPHRIPTAQPSIDRITQIERQQNNPPISDR